MVALFQFLLLQLTSPPLYKSSSTFEAHDIQINQFLYQCYSNYIFQTILSCYFNALRPKLKKKNQKRVYSTQKVKYYFIQLLLQLYALVTCERKCFAHHEQWPKMCASLLSRPTGYLFIDWHYLVSKLVFFFTPNSIINSFMCILIIYLKLCFICTP